MPSSVSITEQSCLLVSRMRRAYLGDPMRVVRHSFLSKFEREREFLVRQEHQNLPHPTGTLDSEDIQNTVSVQQPRKVLLLFGLATITGRCMYSLWEQVSAAWRSPNVSESRVYRLKSLSAMRTSTLDRRGGLSLFTRGCFYLCC
jgi:hypothetical protein